MSDVSAWSAAQGRQAALMTVFWHLDSCIYWFFSAFGGVKEGAMVRDIPGVATAALHLHDAERKIRNG